MDHLALAVSAALDAGALIREEFHRPPRGSGDKADVDVEAERAIRARLLGACPDYGYRGEETGLQAGGPLVWVVDPNDGTRDFLKGRRGSTVSIALLREGVPVLGVVHSPTDPDDDGRLFAWEEGRPPIRAVEPLPYVLVTPNAERRSAAYAPALHPLRMRTCVSVAHRLALVAAGEAVAGLGLRGPRDWDYAAGHALLLGSGAKLLDKEGRPVTYSRDGESAERDVVGTYEDRWRAPSWAVVGSGSPVDGPFVQPEPGRAHRDAARLRRAQGCLLGQVVGDTIGGLVEFRRPGEFAVPAGPADGGTWGTIAGQPTDDSELALALARSIVAEGAWSASAAMSAYQKWYADGPFDVGTTTRRALEGVPDAASQANGSLMRISPLGLLGWRASAAGSARADSALTHPNPVCQDACAAFVEAVACAVATGDAQAAVKAALAAARTPEVRAAILADAPPDFLAKPGWVLVALRNAFYRLRTAATFEAAILETIAQGGDTDTNAAVAGALVGAVRGRESIPLRWRLAVLTCRPLPGVRHPRPREYWPVDLLELAERLIVLGS